MSAPTVSILMPVYNAATHLGRCLDGIVAQTLPDWELVVVDDGSTDDTPALLEARAAAEPRIRVLRCPHRGIVPALNEGLAACRGTYVARMDADDHMLPRRLERQLAWMQARPGMGLCGSLGDPVAPEGGVLSSGVQGYHDWVNAQVEPERITAAMFRESPVLHPTFFGHRTVFEALGGYHDPPWPEDYDLLWRALLADVGVGKVPEVLVQRWDPPTRLTRTDARYKRPAMFQAKAHYLARGPWLRDRPGVVIGGSGTSGRALARRLREQDVPVLAFLDNVDGPPGRLVLDVPAHGFSEAIPPDFLAAHPGAYYLSCIGQEAGRDLFRRQLEAHGLREVRDFAVCI